MTINKSGVIEKGWGSERIWVSNEFYCSKYMNFKPGAKFSMHFHKMKKESWLILSGTFQLTLIDTNTAGRTIIELRPGDTHTNETMVPHQLLCVSPEGGVILEVSTTDHKEDNYRVEPGDSQCQKS